jgi:hypothetical protein
VSGVFPVAIGPRRLTVVFRSISGTVFAALVSRRESPAAAAAFLCAWAAGLADHFSNSVIASQPQEVP